jgi:hypothetical protein
MAQQWVDTVVSIVTAVGVIVAAYQLWMAKNHAVTQFEDQLAREYRQIAGRLPIDAFLGKEMPPEKFEKALPQFYRYFRLTNTQILLRMCRRISQRTWELWSLGIERHLKLPSFRAAWRYVEAQNTEHVHLLKLFIDHGFADPRRWPRPEQKPTNLLRSGELVPPRVEVATSPEAASRVEQPSSR